MSDRRPVVAAMVLAAGSSSRMGRNKLLLEVGGETLVRRAVRAAVESGVDRVFVVLGHEEERIRGALDGLPYVPVANPDHGQGFATSLRAGVRAAEGADAIVIVLADMPFVTADMIAALVDRYRATGAPLAVSHYGEVQAPPTLYARALFAELLSTPGERCAKEVVRRHAHEAAVVDWPDRALRDVDVPADYEELRARSSARATPQDRE
jgi:molybdenum cofactor cytidylyltransferase